MTKHRVRRVKAPDGELVPLGMLGKVIDYQPSELYPGCGVATVEWDNGLTRKGVAHCMEVTVPLHEVYA